MKHLKKTIAAAALLPSVAMAHPGHEAGTVLAGMEHPLSGADHILAMVAIGLMAVQLGGRALWAVPAGFVGSMLVGAAMGAHGVAFFSVEPLILASIIVLGAVVALSARLPVAALVPMVALFGMAHGWAHGAEGPAHGMAAYFAGFTLATAALHVAGMVFGRVIHRFALRGMGVATAVAGLALAFAG
ncbi:HupE/UreJ family protein [Thioclava sp. GXIMD4215]|uniref:HupE/UreJ family protein n=1 Tax=Thioclava sp. GXIMD4215 TaxID=3131928 RepID=UPI003255932F